MKRLLRLYPAAWRARYEAEVADLLDALPTDRSQVLDLIRGAYVERTRSASVLFSAESRPSGGSPMFDHTLNRHATSLAILALLLVLPTATIVGLSVLAWELGVVGLQPIIEPVVVALPNLELVSAFVLVAPMLALVLAFAPLLGFGLTRPDGGLMLTLEVQPRAINLAVIGVCLVVGVVLTGHHLVEVMLERGL